MFNRRGFFGRALGLLGLPFVSRVAPKRLLREFGPENVIVRHQTESPGLPRIQYYACSGDSAWHEVELNDITGRRGDSDVSVQA